MYVNIATLKKCNYILEDISNVKYVGLIEQMHDISCEVMSCGLNLKSEFEDIMYRLNR